MRIIIRIILLTVVSVSIYFLVGSSVTKNLDTYVYDLPYGQGTRHRVVHGYGGKFSHKNKAALDFEMPVGTPYMPPEVALLLVIKIIAMRVDLFQNTMASQTTL